MQEVYNWVDEIPLSRPKKNIARDFSDCGKLQILAFNAYPYILLIQFSSQRFSSILCRTLWIYTTIQMRIQFNKRRQTGIR